MAKRFVDTDKFKKRFIRGLQGAYKVLWDYICCDCDHAGIWYVDFQVAQIYLGSDLPVNEQDALKFFNSGEDRIIVLDQGKKWFIPSFVEFQYGVLNPENRAHSSVVSLLLKAGVDKGLVRALQGRKDKDKDKDKDKGGMGGFEDFWKLYPKKRAKDDAIKAWSKISPQNGLMDKILDAVKSQSKSDEWTKQKGKFIPYPASWLNGKRWEDEAGEQEGGSRDAAGRELRYL